MFLDLLRRRNPALLGAAAGLALRGDIPPNSYVMDLDTVRDNGRVLRAEAERLGLKLYFMTKQHGRNPAVTRALVDGDRPETVAVDIDDVDALARHAFRLGHVGNLVQIPRASLPRVVGELRPEVMTVFSVAKAAQVAAAARAVEHEQAILLRVADPGRDTYLPGMEGGIPLDGLARAAAEIRRLQGVRVEGVTTFPALSYRDVAEPRATSNFQTLLTARDILAREGLRISQINAPGNTCVYTMETQAQLGATHVEPGHGALGTTPFHLLVDGLPERPAYCYVTEVAHHVGGRAYVYGGGFFVDDPVWLASDFQRFALVGQSVDELLGHRERFLGAGSGSSGSFGGIDYYGFLDADERRAPVGATVIFGFRIQAFVTRAKVAVVRNVQSHPELVGIWDTNAHPLAAAA